MELSVKVEVLDEEGAAVLDPDPGNKLNPPSTRVIIYICVYIYDINYLKMRMMIVRKTNLNYQQMDALES